MAKKGSGEGNVRNLTVEILRQIRGELTGLRSEVGGLRSEVGDLRSEVGGMREELTGVREELTGVREDLTDLRGEVRSTNARVSTLERVTVHGFREVSARLDHLVGLTGEKYRDHERRIGRLERHAFPRRAT